jgi:hypothetical protein
MLLLELEAATWLDHPWSSGAMLLNDGLTDHPSRITDY